MSVIRVQHNKNNPYVILNKDALWDKNLTLEAVGLWARLLSRPDDWQIYASELCKSCGCGETKMYRLLNELIDKGYAYRHHAKGKNGKFIGYEYFVFESPMKLEEIKIILPHLDFPGLVDPGLGNHGLLSTDPIPSIKSIREEATPPPPLFQFGKVKMDQVKYDKLVHDFGQETVNKVLVKLDEYGDINPKRFKQYACHGTVIRKWLREDLEKLKATVNGLFANDRVEENQKLAKKIVDTFKVQVDKNEIQLQDMGLLFCYGQIYDLIKFTDFKFLEKVKARLAKMNLFLKDE